MMVDVTYGGYIKAIYPSEPDNVQEITVRENETDGRCALYLSVLQELFNTDETLQSDTEYISVDLTKTPLTKGEIQAIAWRLSLIHISPISLLRRLSGLPPAFSLLPP